MEESIQFEHLKAKTTHSYGIQLQNKLSVVEHILAPKLYQRNIYGIFKTLCLKIRTEIKDYRVF